MNITSNPTKSETTLYFLEDVFERAMTPFFLLGETAKSVADQYEVDGDIEIGIRRNSLTEFARGVLAIFIPQIEKNLKDGDKVIEFEHDGVSVRLKVIEKMQGSSMFMHPNQEFYKVTQFGLPNPFKKYWKMRNLVR